MGTSNNPSNTDGPKLEQRCVLPVGNIDSGREIHSLAIHIAKVFPKRFMRLGPPYIRSASPYGL